MSFGVCVESHCCVLFVFRFVYVSCAVMSNVPMIPTMRIGSSSLPDMAYNHIVMVRNADSKTIIITFVVVSMCLLFGNVVCLCDVVRVNHVVQWRPASVDGTHTPTGHDVQ